MQTLIEAPLPWLLLIAFLLGIFYTVVGAGLIDATRWSRRWFDHSHGLLQVLALFAWPLVVALGALAGVLSSRRPGRARW